MKKIDALLANEKESYKSVISKFESVLLPFAMFAIGKTPVYMGHPLKSISMGFTRDEDVVFNINDNDLATVNLKSGKMEVFNSEAVLEADDLKSVIALTEAAKKRNEEKSADREKSSMDALMGDLLLHVLSRGMRS